MKQFTLAEELMRAFWLSLSQEDKDNLLRTLAQEHGVLLTMEFETTIEELTDEA